MSYWQNINPSGAPGQLVAAFRDAGPRRWPIAVASLLCTVGIFSMMATQNWKAERRLPKVEFITSFPADQTEAERKAFVAANQRRKEADAALQEQYDADGRHMWKAIGRASGLDVDSMEAKAEAERKAEAAAAAARAKAVLDQSLKAADDTPSH